MFCVDRLPILWEKSNRRRGGKVFIIWIKQNWLNIERRCMARTQHKSHVGGEWLGFHIHKHQVQVFSLLTYSNLSPAFHQCFSSGGAPAMNPSSVGFSRQSNLSARDCVGIPQVWVLPTQNSHTAPEEKEWNTPESLLCVVLFAVSYYRWFLVWILPWILALYRNSLQLLHHHHLLLIHFFIINCFPIQRQHEFLCANDVVEDHGMPSELGGEGSGSALEADRPPPALRESAATAWDQASPAGHQQLRKEHHC